MINVKMAWFSNDETILYIVLVFVYVYNYLSHKKENASIHTLFYTCIHM